MVDDPELAAALAMSMGQDPSEDTPMLTEDEELQRALAMSMQESVCHFNIEFCCRSCIPKQCDWYFARSGSQRSSFAECHKGRRQEEAKGGGKKEINCVEVEIYC
jgi:hypothetical protein